MAIAEKFRLQTAYDGRTESQIGHEVSVHHVDVQPFTKPLNRSDFFIQLTEVGGENGRRDFESWGQV